MSAALAPPEAPVLMDATAFAREMRVSDSQLADLDRFQSLLVLWNERMNLVGEATLQDFWRRHALDSAQLLALAPQARTWADLGAGAGFPGVVLAILLKGAPGALVHLVESRRKRCDFLAAASEALDLPTQIHHARAEDLALAVEVVTARAVAPLAELLAFAKPSLDRGGVSLFLKGKGAEAEVAEAHKTWRFSLRCHPSLSDPSGRILEIGGLSRVR